MEPIISPLWFYLIDTVTSLKAFFMMTGIITIIVLGMISAGHAGWSMKDLHNFWKCKLTRILAVTSLIFIIAGCFIPSAETAYKMLVASLVTPDNIAAVGESASNVVDYIIESVDKLIESKQ